MVFIKYAVGFHNAETRKVWEAYTKDYYKMDTYYRLFHLNFGQSLNSGNGALDDLFKHVVEKVENLYNDWFLNQLSSNWSNVAADELAEYGRILEVKHQEHFYRSKVAGADSKVTLDNCEAIFPTITKFGMAALLPHNELTAVQKPNKQVAVLADGQSMESNNRDNLLKLAHGESVALQYKNIIGMKRATLPIQWFLQPVRMPLQKSKILLGLSALNLAVQEYISLPITDFIYIQPSDRG